MTPGVLSTILASSALGSLHCAGMCGPFVAFYSGADSGGRQRWIGHAGYHAGRLATYLTLGAAAGALGQGLDRLAVLSGIGRLAGLAAGALMLGWGLLLASRTAHLGALRLPLALRRWLVGFTARLRARPPLGRALLLGLSTALLPCGWLYAFIVAAAGTASPIAGAVILLSLWLGSLPALLGLGIGVQTVFQRVRPYAGWLNAAALIALGALGVAGRLDMPKLALDRVHSVLGPDGRVHGSLDCCPKGETRR